MLKRLAVLFAVLALVAAACGGSDDSSDTTTTTAAEGDSSGQETTDTGESTLATVVDTWEADLWSQWIRDRVLRNRLNRKQHRIRR